VPREASDKLTRALLDLAASGLPHTLRNAIYKLTIVDYEAVVDRYLGPGCS
jgi:hypothetical protein